MEGSGQSDRGLAELSVEGAEREIAWADPAKAMLEIERWRRLKADGVPIGADPYSAYCAEDGSLPLWPLAAVLDEARLARRFVEEELDAPYAGLRVPGPETMCADGDFLPALLGIEPDVRLGLPRLSEAE